MQNLINSKSKINAVLKLHNSLAISDLHLPIAYCIVAYCLLYCYLLPLPTVLLLTAYCIVAYCLLYCCLLPIAYCIVAYCLLYCCLLPTDTEGVSIFINHFFYNILTN